MHSNSHHIQFASKFHSNQLDSFPNKDGSDLATSLIIFDIPCMRPGKVNMDFAMMFRTFFSELGRTG